MMRSMTHVDNQLTRNFSHFARIGLIGGTGVLFHYRILDLQHLIRIFDFVVQLSIRVVMELDLRSPSYLNPLHCSWTLALCQLVY
jgi:hypothetical protein